MHPRAFQAPLAVPASPSLDPDRISVENPSTQTPEQEWRFRFCAELRGHLLANLSALGVPPKHANRFEGCGAHAWVQYSASADRYRVRADSCNLRWCPACRRSAGGHTREWLKQVFELTPQHGWKLITLTMKHRSAPLADQISTLRLSFRRLRQRAFWKAAVRGGVYILEVSFNEQTQSWHPHFHVLADSRFIPQRSLSRHWLSVTGSSSIVDIRPVAGTDKTVDYLTKYLTKSPPRAVTSSIPRMAELIGALHGARMINRFGSAPQYVPEDSADGPVRDWEPVSSLAHVLASARCGDQTATRILSLLGGSPDGTVHPDLDVGRQSALPFLSGGP